MAKADTSGVLNAMALNSVDLCTTLAKAGVEHLTPSAIGKWVQAGCPRNPDKTFNTFRVLAWFVNERAKIPYKAHAESDEEKKESIGLKRERRLAVRQARLADAKKLVDREEVREEWMARLHALKSGLLTLSRVLVREVVGQPAPVVQKVVDFRVNDILLAYAEGWDGEGDIPGEEKNLETETRPDHDAGD